MSMRPIQFAKRGPGVGNVAVAGLDSALDNYAKLHMQKLQMQAMQKKNQAQAQFQQARAANLQRQNQNADMSRVQAVVAHAQLARSQGDPDAAKAYMKAAQPMIDKLAQTMPKDQADAMTAHAKSQLEGGQWPQEFGDESLNPNEQKIYGQMQGNQTKENVAETSATARTDSATKYGDTRVKVAQIGAGAHVQGAQIAAGTKGPQMSKQDQIAFKASQQRETDLATRYADADKASGMGMAPDPSDVTKKRAILMDMMAKEHDAQNKITSGQSGQAGAPPAQQAQTPASGVGPTPNGYGGAPAQPKTLPASQRMDAQPGDIVKHDNGALYKALGNDQWVPVPPQQAQPQGAASDPSAGQ